VHSGGTDPHHDFAEFQCYHGHHHGIGQSGTSHFEASVALILGDNIGTTITAELASIGASINAHRTARAHAIFNVIGVINVVIFFPIF
jgi:phosphate:Na+ symporter